MILKQAIEVNAYGFFVMTRQCVVSLDGARRLSLLRITGNTFNVSGKRTYFQFVYRYFVLHIRSVTAL